MIAVSNSSIIPDEHRYAFCEDLGKYPDQTVADMWSEKLDIEIGRHVPFFFRKQLGIEPFKKQTYTKPGFSGKIEDAHPEIKEMIGKATVTAIAEHFGVSRSCVRAAAGRLEIGTRVDSDAVFDAIGIKN